MGVGFSISKQLPGMLRLLVTDATQTGVCMAADTSRPGEAGEAEYEQGRLRNVKDDIFKWNIKSEKNQSS